MAIAKVLSEEQIKRHVELYDQFVAAITHARAVLIEHGMKSKEFEEADKAAGLIAEEIHRLIGRRHWMG